MIHEGKTEKDFDPLNEDKDMEPFEKANMAIIIQHKKHIWTSLNFHFRKHHIGLKNDAFEKSSRH